MKHNENEMLTDETMRQMKIHGTLMPAKGKQRNVMLQKDLGRAKIFSTL